MTRDALILILVLGIGADTVKYVCTHTRKS